MGGGSRRIPGATVPSVLISREPQPMYADIPRSDKYVQRGSHRTPAADLEIMGVGTAHGPSPRTPTPEAHPPRYPGTLPMTEPGADRLPLAR